MLKSLSLPQRFPRVVRAEPRRWSADFSPQRRCRAKHFRAPVTIVAGGRFCGVNAAFPGLHSNAPHFAFDLFTLYCKVIRMNSNWAEENIQVIRTLMERAALYRRAMAPMMFLAGGFALAGAVGAEVGGLENLRTFILFWGVIALAVLIGSGLIVRKQAVKKDEPFWTVPARRVFRSFLPVILVGGVIGAAKVFDGLESPQELSGIGHSFAASWALLYGLGLHSAGAFVAKGIKRLGWCFIICGVLMSVDATALGGLLLKMSPNILMGIVFGGLHLVAGIYLHFTEQKDEAA